MRTQFRLNGQGINIDGLTCICVKRITLCLTTFIDKTAKNYLDHTKYSIYVSSVFVRSFPFAFFFLFSLSFNFSSLLRFSFHSSSFSFVSGYFKLIFRSSFFFLRSFFQFFILSVLLLRWLE